MRNLVTVSFKDNKIIQFEADERYYTDPEMKTYTFTCTDKVRIISCESVKYIAIDKTY